MIDILTFNYNENFKHAHTQRWKLYKKHWENIWNTINVYFKLFYKFYLSIKIFYKYTGSSYYWTITENNVETKSILNNIYIKYSDIWSDIFRLYFGKIVFLIIIFHFLLVYNIIIYMRVCVRSMNCKISCSRKE